MREVKMKWQGKVMEEKETGVGKVTEGKGSPVEAGATILHADRKGRRSE